MNINHDLFIDIKKFLNHLWSITTKDLEQYDAEINQAAKAVTELRSTGKGPDGSLVLFPHLPAIILTIKSDFIMVIKEHYSTSVRSFRQLTFWSR